jgi:membrane-associated PAP2 superfamily phosphatase
MTFRRTRILAIAAAVVLLLAVQVFTTSARAPRILSWDTMVGVPQDLVSAASQGPLRGISGGGLPWTLIEAPAT